MKACFPCTFGHGYDQLTNMNVNISKQRTLFKSCFIVTAFTISPLVMAENINITMSVTITTERAGLLAQLAHRHTIRLKQLTQVVNVEVSGQQVTVSPFTQQVLVEDLILDDPTDRTRYLPDEKQPGDKAIQSTYKNMFGKKVLNSRIYPEINWEVQGFKCSLNDDCLIPITLHFKGKPYQLEISGHFSCEQYLSFTASHTLLQSKLRLRPFSAGFGSIKVGDQLKLNISVWEQMTSDGKSKLCQP
ncbi:MAG: hypothetical protein ACWA5R_02120 [bacterium]